MRQEEGFLALGCGRSILRGRLLVMLPRVFLVEVLAEGCRDRFEQLSGLVAGQWEGLVYRGEELLERVERGRSDHHLGRMIADDETLGLVLRGYSGITPSIGISVNTCAVGLASPILR